MDAALASGRYSREQLLELATASDGGFDPLLFAEALGALTQITDAAFAECRVPLDTIAKMRHRFADWRQPCQKVSSSEPFSQGADQEITGSIDAQIVTEFPAGSGRQRPQPPRNRRRGQ